MKTSEVFSLARGVIENGHNRRICFAIDCVNAPLFAKRYAAQVVMKRISPWRFLETWAQHNSHCKGVERATDADFREFRIRWLKALETEFKANGD